MWDTSTQQVRQLPNVGRLMAQKLAAEGLGTLAALGTVSGSFCLKHCAIMAGAQCRPPHGTEAGSGGAGDAGGTACGECHFMPTMF